MGFFGKYFSGLLGKKEQPEERSGDMRKATGAGPALAAHSKDAKTTAPAVKTRLQRGSNLGNHHSPLLPAICCPLSGPRV